MSKELDLVHPNAAGIDCGSTHFFVNAIDNEVKTFATHTRGCKDLLSYLQIHQVTTVAIESTGVYWIVLEQILSEAGIDVFIVNGKQTKNIPGRKTDVKDCQWIKKLHSNGLLNKSFIPPAEFQVLREFMRNREDYIRSRATQVHRMQKALILMNIRLPEVLSDIAGVSGLKMIEAIISGERNPEVLLEYCDTRIKKNKREEILKSLEGYYQPQHIFTLKKAKESYDLFTKQIGDCDEEMSKLLNEMTANLPDF